MGWALSPTKPETLERYVIRDVIWCGPCERPMEPVLVSGGRRHYGCPKRTCARLVPAEETEQRVWSRFVQLNELLAHGVRRDQRYALLRQVLARVIVGETATDLMYEWRD
jgi:hypothetical protein